MTEPGIRRKEAFKDIHRQTGVNKQLKKRRRVSSYWYLFFILPTIVATALIIAYPVTFAVGLSLFQVSGIPTLTNASYAGFSNYGTLARDQTVYIGLENSLIWTIGTVAAAFFIGLGLALLLNASLAGRGILRAVILIPWAIPSVPAAVLWEIMYSQDFGLINFVLRGLRFIQQPLPWLASSDLALPALMIAYVWRSFPFIEAVLLAGLQSIPNELYEASVMDGANALQRFTKVTLPLMRNVILVVVLLSVIWHFNHFDTVFIITQGGPGYSTLVLSVLTYETGWKFLQWSYASSMAVLMLTVVSLLAVVYLRASARVGMKE